MHFKIMHQSRYFPAYSYVEFVELYGSYVKAKWLVNGMVGFFT